MTDHTPPTWLNELANEVASHLYAVDLLSPLGCHVYRNQALDQWELTLFASRTRVVGGQYDGREIVSEFSADIAGIVRLFDNVSELHWHALAGATDELGTHISLEGHLNRKNVWLRITAEPPVRFEPGRTAHAYNLRLEEHW